MRKLLAFLTIAAFAATLYVLSPFYAAWQLREAIKAGDTPTISRKVEWDSVRASVRASLSAQTELAPVAVEMGRQVNPTVWQRLKSAFGATMLDRFVETYITPEGLPKLAQYGKRWRETVKPATTTGDDNRNWQDRVADFYSRVRRAEITGLTSALLEIADKHDPDRSYVGVFELIGFEWKLTRLQIRTGANTHKLARL